MPHPLDLHPLHEVSRDAWNAIKSAQQPIYDELGVEFKAKVLDWAEHARSGQPIEEGDHPRARFERKVAELGADTEPFYMEVPVRVEGGIVHVPSFTLPSAFSNPDIDERRVNVNEEALAHPVPEFDSFTINEVQVPELAAQDHVEAESVVDSTDEEPDSPPDVSALKGPLPKDFPARELLRDAGINTYTQLGKIDDFTSIAGIGGATAEKIANRLVEESQKGSI